jgi:NAD(P)-dependent dehydrogenase (short-subunit alcohol dehydrogenase family)
MQDNVFITGSGSGLGKQTALHFARQGYRVFAGVRRAEDAAALVEESEAIYPVVIDVADPAQVQAAAEVVARECGERGLFAVIHVAGRALYAPVEYTAPSDAAALFEVLTFGPYRLTNALLPALKRAARHGRRSKVINIISWAALDASPFTGFYAAAKAALLRLTEAQFFELERFGIDAIAVLPGLMRTPFIDRVGEQIERTLARLPLEARRDYGPSLQHLSKMSEQAPTNPLASDPATIARKIFVISQKRRAKYRYHLGVDTWLVRFITTFFPQWLQRALKRSLFGLDLDKLPHGAVSKILSEDDLELVCPKTPGSPVARVAPTGST